MAVEKIRLSYKGGASGLSRENGGYEYFGEGASFSHFLHLIIVLFQTSSLMILILILILIPDLQQLHNFCSSTSTAIPLPE